MKLSVVLTVRNEEEHLPACLDGIQSQTLAPFELVVVDDGSEDQTLQILNVFRGSASFPVIIIPSTGVGRSKALTRALESASGDIIVVQDGDDVSRPRRLELHRNAFLGDSALDWHAGQLNYVGTDGESLMVSRYPTNPDDIRRQIARSKMPVAHCASAYRRSLTEHGIWYDPKMRRAQDLNLVLRRGLELKIAATSEVLVDYRTEAVDVSWTNWHRYRLEHYYAVTAAAQGTSDSFDVWLEQRTTNERIRHLDLHEWAYGKMRRAVAGLRRLGRGNR